MTKTCLNPSCRKKFTPGHYGDRQLVCPTDGCRRWYKTYATQTKKPPRGIPSEDFAKIKSEAVKGAPVYHALLIAARESGMRKGELLGLTWGDIVDAAGKVRSTISLRGQWSEGVGFKATKTGASRTAYLPEPARGPLQNLYTGCMGSGREKAGQRVFPLSECGVWRWFEGLQRRLKIKNPETGAPYRFHDLRHCVGLELVKAGRVDLAQKMLGHRNINTTMGYAVRSPEEILDDVERVRRGINRG